MTALIVEYSKLIMVVLLIGSIIGLSAFGNRPYLSSSATLLSSSVSPLSSSATLMSPSTKADDPALRAKVASPEALDTPPARGITA